MKGYMNIPECPDGSYLQATPKTGNYDLHSTSQAKERNTP